MAVININEKLVITFSKRTVKVRLQIEGWADGEGTLIEYKGTFRDTQTMQEKEVVVYKDMKGDWIQFNPIFNYTGSDYDKQQLRDAVDKLEGGANGNGM